MSEDLAQPHRDTTTQGFCEWKELDILITASRRLTNWAGRRYVQPHFDSMSMPEENFAGVEREVQAQEEASTSSGYDVSGLIPRLFRSISLVKKVRCAAKGLPTMGLRTRMEGCRKSQERRQMKETRSRSAMEPKPTFARRSSPSHAIVVWKSRTVNSPK